MNWNKIRHAKWFIPVLAVLAVAMITGGVLAATGWLSTSIPATGTINVTPPPDFNYTLSSNIDFGTSSFVTGTPVSITGTVLVTNTGNQPINTLAVAGMNLPNWITTVSITQTPVPVGVAQQETVTLSGTAPSTAQTVNLVGSNAVSTVEITITPGS